MFLCKFDNRQRGLVHVEGHNLLIWLCPNIELAVPIHVFETRKGENANQILLESKKNEPKVDQSTVVLELLGKDAAGCAKTMLEDMGCRGAYIGALPLEPRGSKRAAAI
jgi:hypothetical protein